MASTSGAKSIYALKSGSPISLVYLLIELLLLLSITQTGASLLLRRSKAEPSAASKEREAAVEAKLQTIQKHNAGRKPDWDTERLVQVQPPQSLTLIAAER